MNAEFGRGDLLDRHEGDDGLFGRLVGGPTGFGRYDGRLPYVRVGDGPKPLVVLPGLADALWRGVPNRALAAVLARRFRAYTDEYTVWVLSRPRNLSPEATTRTMAGGVATVVDELGAVDLLGRSMGGFVAQHLAADYPALVDRLVLVASGAHLGQEGRHVVERWRRYALEERWGDLGRDVVRVSGDSPRHYAAEALVTLGVGAGVVRPATPEDVVRSCRACLDHDTADRLADVPHETLVLGGERDRLVPEAVLRATARDLPNARVGVVPNAGHAIAEEHRPAVDAAVLRFLRG